MKKYIISVGISLTILIGISLINNGHNIFSYFHYLVWGNSLQVRTENIDKSKITIVWEGAKETHGKNLDFQKKVMIYHKGENYNKNTF